MLEPNRWYLLASSLSIIEMNTQYLFIREDNSIFLAAVNRQEGLIEWKKRVEKDKAPVTHFMKVDVKQIKNS